MGLLYTQALADRAQAWLGQPLVEKRSAEGLLELATIWAAIHRQPLPECLRQCQYSERSQSVAAYLLEFSRLPTSLSAMSETTQSSYQFAPQFANETLVHEDLAGPVTAANLTDEVAEFFIKQGRKDLFVKRGAQAETDEPAGAIGVQPAQPLVPEADLTAEQQAHDETTAKLEQAQALLGKEEADHEATSQKLQVAEAALVSEKQAHTTTKGQLGEVQAKNDDLTKQVADLSKQLAKAKAKPVVAASPAIVSPPAPLAPTSLTDEPSTPADQASGAA